MPRSSSTHKPGERRVDRREQASLFSKRLKDAIARRGWTAAETARRVREHLGKDGTFTQANIGHYLSGRSRPRARYLTALSAALGTGEEYFGQDNLSSKGEVTNLAKLGPADDNSPPPFHLEDRGCEVWLEINQQVPWSVALKILRMLKADG
jgi:transcriptional regulator with XRE-family HTH domain